MFEQDVARWIRWRNRQNSNDLVRFPKIGIASITSGYVTGSRSKWFSLQKDLDEKRIMPTENDCTIITKVVYF
jgi:hypothetical protein